MARHLVRDSPLSAPLSPQSPRLTHVRSVSIATAAAATGAAVYLGQKSKRSTANKNRKQTKYRPWVGGGSSDVFSVVQLSFVY